MSTSSSYCSSYISGAMNSGVPRTDIPGCACLSSVARPKSPIFTSPLWPLMKMLSHLRSLWITGGSCSSCRYARPSRICLDHRLMALVSSLVYFLRNCLRVPDVKSSVMKTMFPVHASTQDSKKVMTWGCLSSWPISISAWSLFLSSSVNTLP